LERTLEEPLAKRKPGWLKETVQEAEKIVAPKGTFRESKRPRRFGGYVALMSSISDAEPSSFEEADRLQVWKDAMLEEYKSIVYTKEQCLGHCAEAKGQISGLFQMDL
jgi:hypothetical protein